MKTTQEQPQLNKEVIQLQTIVIVNTTVVHDEQCTNDATTGSEEISTSSDNSFASNYNLFTESTDVSKNCNTYLSCKKFAYTLATVLTICVISGLFLCPIVSYIMRETFDFRNDENFNDTSLVCCIVQYACSYLNISCLIFVNIMASKARNAWK